MSKSTVVVRDLTKTYGGFAAVKGISFEIGEGEIFGLLGPNGAGKTTTISMLSCLLEPSAGEAAVAGWDVSKEREKVKQSIGIVPQELALYPTLSARDNLLFFGRMYGLRGKKLNQRIDEVLGIVGLSDRAGDTVRKFSGGMKRRLNLAAGLVHGPDVLFLDEPTVGVDPQSRNHIFENVVRLNREGMTIIYTTHYMEEAELLCHRVGIMDEGKIIALDTPRSLINSMGQSLIYIGTDQNGANVIPCLRALPQVKKVSKLENRLAVETVDAQRAVTGIIAALNESGMNLTSLEIREPNLENVFLNLTGKKLRD